MHALLVQHSVADFDTWKTAFDGHDSARRDLGVTMTNLHRVNGSPNEVVLFMGVKDADAALAAFASAEMQQSMKDAGVTSEPTIEVLESRAMDLPPSEAKVGVLFKHPVVDFEKWQVVFNDHDETRRVKGGTDGSSVNTRRDDANYVVGYIRGTDMNRLKSFFGASSASTARLTTVDTLHAMAAAGVSAAPTFLFLDHVEVKHYE